MPTLRQCRLVQVRMARADKLGRCRRAGMRARSALDANSASAALIGGMSGSLAVRGLTVALGTVPCRRQKSG